MSASALKSTIPGVGTSPTSASHSILPMNAMAQKVVSGSEPGSMKPLPGTGLSYVTLQPPSQPLSLVQDHRPSVYQTPPYVSSNSEKESDLDKLIPNGVEIIKAETEQTMSVAIKQSESNRNNNLSPDNPTQESPKEIQTEQAMTSISLDFPALCPQLQNKVEEKKTSVNNGSKESDGTPINTAIQTKLSSHKVEDSSVKADSQKSKATSQNTKFAADSSAMSQTNNPPKVETKVTGSPKANKRKSRELKDLKGISAASDGASKPKRNRIQTQPYQSPLPEIALLVKNLNKPPPSKAIDDKLIVFYKNEFLAVRNAEGSFYVCQAMQNIYKSSRRIRIRWLSQDKNNGEIYSPDFYDFIDFDCILTNLNLNKIDKNKFQLTKIELLRTENILKRAIDVEAGVSEKPRVTEEHPDGLDLSLYKDESQLKRRKNYSLHKQKQSLRKKSKRIESSSEDETLEEESGKKSPKLNRSKKRTVNKALAIAKSVAKGSSRAERALNRNTKSGTEVTTTINTSVTSGTTAANAVPPVSAPKNNSGVKKSENKKIIKPQNNNSTSGVSRPKQRASTQNIQQQSSKPAGRPKRIAASTSILSTEETTSRKKPRGRA
ncbi:uncharacterized protein LOC128886992 isoform X1 [Hylaeus anthracinus]|uniref:uncharacterized protein LOC128886992 isoform X1 n=1 Tax=Hylaeus anthracinus TaxID=313031 RepID=UPI0023B89690|nr:uncharacterized protein LOC128886992 isoform X1 [Hylaeus anthracinus]XP_053998341.1 uncharacterized protein LOC128886992 isoform X1 [Hylaeus anthracinus]XP_053998342.1 uncharacterized protein LOC128886992 isoform X1 [Hylaeus anthracinus]XP_053998344.1 uncharacterized protein LOC128886992 isoform X1 [Hylaeus anthracinus]XP_053998345.1 uncharacterized protein LOC128886992 isoform X1 [Hylaeus anthracinus]